MAAIHILIPPELVDYCNKELEQYVAIGFTRYNGKEPMYYEDYEINPSENPLWEQARQLDPPATRVTIERVLYILSKNGNIMVVATPDQEESNDELLEYYCQCAVGKYIQRKLHEYLQTHPE